MQRSKGRHAGRQAGLHALVARFVASLAVASAMATAQNVPPAQAATIANTDSMPHTVTVENTTPPQVHAIARHSQTKNVCPAGCVVRLDGREDRYIIEGPELLSIEGGTLYFDGDLPKPKGTTSKP